MADSLGDMLKIIYLGFEKSQRSVTHYFLRYINILTCLLTYDADTQYSKMLRSNVLYNANITSCDYINISLDNSQHFICPTSFSIS